MGIFFKPEPVNDPANRMLTQLKYSSMKQGIDKRFRAPRIWSNQELKKIAPLCQGNIINVSAWQDEDKEGSIYKNYFPKAHSYVISNYKTEARGFQGVENEFFLDLTADLPGELVQKFDVVFNHTTLEHIFNVDKAFYNLCTLSKDLVIIIVPFMQEMHGDYGDYWRFTPLCLQKLFEKNSMSMIYCNFNSQPNTSVYIFAVGSKNPSEWAGKFPGLNKKGLGTPLQQEVAGYNVVTNTRSFSSLISSVSKRFSKAKTKS